MEKRDARRKEYGKYLKQHIDVLIQKQPGLTVKGVADRMDTAVQQLWDNAGGRNVFTVHKVKKLVKALELSDQDAFEFVRCWLEASLKDKDIEGMTWLKELSRSAIQGDTKYHLLDLAEHENIIEELLRDSLKSLKDENAIKILSNPTCLKALSTILDLPGEKQKALFGLLETIGTNQEKLEFISGLLK